MRYADISHTVELWLVDAVRLVLDALGDEAGAAVAILLVALSLSAVRAAYRENKRRSRLDRQDKRRSKDYLPPCSLKRLSGCFLPLIGESESRRISRRFRRRRRTLPSLVRCEGSLPPLLILSGVSADMFV